MKNKHPKAPKQVMHMLTLGDLVKVNGETGVIVESEAESMHDSVKVTLRLWKCDVDFRRVTICHIESEATSMSEKKRAAKKYVKKNRPSETVQKVLPRA